jgi:hypothetical protein
METVIKAENPLVPLAELLEAEGFEGATPETGSGNHITADLSAEPAGGGAFVSVYYYPDPSYARREAAQIGRFLASNPGRGLVHVSGHYLVSSRGEGNGTAAGKQSFEAVVRAAATVEAQGSGSGPKG